MRGGWRWPAGGHRLPACPAPARALAAQADKGCAGLCGAALSAPAVPGFLFEGRDHASDRHRGLPETSPGQSAEQACFKPHPGQWGRRGGHPGPGEGLPGDRSRGREGQLGPAPLADALPASPVPRGASPTSRGATPASRGASPVPRGASPAPRSALPTLRGASPSPRGCIPHAQGCITHPTRPPPHQAGEFEAPLPAAPSSLSPPRRLRGCSRVPRSHPGAPWKAPVGVSTRASPAKVCQEPRWGPVHPMSLGPRQPQQAQPPAPTVVQRHRPAPSGGGGGPNQPCTPPQPPARPPPIPLPRGGHSRRGPNTQRGSGKVHRGTRGVQPAPASPSLPVPLPELL